MVLGRALGRAGSTTPLSKLFLGLTLECLFVCFAFNGQSSLELFFPVKFVGEEGFCYAIQAGMSLDL